jgi:hypothetical protein
VEGTVQGNQVQTNEASMQVPPLTFGSFSAPTKKQTWADLVEEDEDGNDATRAKPKSGTLSSPMEYNTPRTPCGGSGSFSTPQPSHVVSGYVAPLNGIHSHRSTHGGSGLSVSKIAAGSSPKTPTGDSGARYA